MEGCRRQWSSDLARLFDSFACCPWKCISERNRPMISRVQKFSLIAACCTALVGGTATEGKACFPCLFGHGCCYQPTCCYQPSCCSPCTTCGYGPCSSCGTCGSCSSCSSCSSCGGGCADGSCGVSSLPTYPLQSVFAAPLFVQPSMALMPQSDPRFAQPVVRRQVVKSAVQPAQRKATPVRAPKNIDRSIELDRSAKANLRQRSNAERTRIAQPGDATEVVRRVRTSVVTSNASVVR